MKTRPRVSRSRSPLLFFILVGMGLLVARQLSDRGYTTVLGTSSSLLADKGGDSGGGGGDHGGDNSGSSGSGGGNSNSNSSSGSSNSGSSSSNSDSNSGHNPTNSTPGNAAAGPTDSSVHSTSEIETEPKDVLKETEVDQSIEPPDQVDTPEATDDHGQGSELQVKRDDGTQAKVETESLNEINDLLKTEHDLEIEMQASGSVLLKQSGIETQSRLPLTVDVKNKSLVASTSAGQSPITILPNQVIDTVIAQNILSSVESGQSSSASTLSGQTAAIKMVLTQVGDHPAFEVHGKIEKKLLGIVPVSIARVVFVSAGDGSVIKTTEDILGKLLDRLSL